MVVAHGPSTSPPTSTPSRPPATHTQCTAPPFLSPTPCCLYWCLVSGVCWVRSSWVGQVRSDLVRSCQVMSSLPGTCQRPLHGNQHTASSLNFDPLLKRIRFTSTSPSPPPIHHSLLVPVIHGLLCINQAACVQLTYRNSRSAELIDGGPLPSALHYHYSPNVYKAQGSRC